MSAGNEDNWFEKAKKVIRPLARSLPDIVGKLVILVLGVGFLVLVAWALYQLFDSIKYSSGTFQGFVTLITVTYVIVVPLLFVVAIWLVFRLFIRGLRLFWTSVCRTNSGVGWVALGVTTLVFGRVVVQFFQAAITFLLSLLVNLPPYLSQTWQSGMANCASTQSLNDCLGRVGLDMFMVWGGTINNAVGRAQLVALPFHQLILFFALWMVLGRALCAATRRTEPAWVNDLLDSFRNLSRIVVSQNFVLLVFLVLGLYLGFAALVATISLESVTGSPEPPAVAQLEETLAAVPVWTVENIDSAVASIEEDPFKNLEEGLKELDVENWPKDEFGRERSLVQQIRSTVEANRRDLAQLKGDYGLLMTNAMNSAETARRNVVQDYELNSGYRTGGQEQIRYFDLLNEWYGQQVRGWKEQIAGCENEIGNLQQLYGLWARLADNEIEAVSRTVSGTSGVGPMDWDTYFERQRALDPLELTATEVLTEAEGQCQSRVATSGMPQRPPPGSSLGALNAATSWLTQTESQSVATLVGVLGFGLLGSVASTWIQRLMRSTRGRNSPRLLMQGFLSALVVYLGVQGGLLVFATNSTPNPLALMFVCCLAAVFNEKVWAALEKFLGNLIERKGPEGENEPAEAPQPSQADTQPSTGGEQEADVAQSSGGGEQEADMAQSPGDSAPEDNTAQSSGDIAPEGGKVDPDDAPIPPKPV